MAQPKLRIYYGDDSPAAELPAPRNEPKSVTMPLADLFPLLADAARSRRAWLADFADDQITISQDLYEVVLAYQHYCRPEGDARTA